MARAMRWQQIGRMLYLYYVTLGSVVVCRFNDYAFKLSPAKQYPVPGSSPSVDTDLVVGQD